MTVGRLRLESYVLLTVPEKAAGWPMSTPLGHMLAGATATFGSRPRTSLRKKLSLGALTGAAPDLDFVPGLLVGDPARFHHGPSHSLALALAVAVVAWLVASRDRWRWALVAGLAYASHLVLDAVTIDPSSPVGLQLFWPVSEAYVASPFRPLPRVLHSATSVINFHNFTVMGLELVLFGGLLCVCLWASSGARRP